MRADAADERQEGNRLPSLAPARPVTACKVCGHSAALYGVVDFNKNCEEPKGTFLPLAGLPVYYHQCESCRLVFTEVLDRWQKADYLDHIYNEKYVDVDPDYIEARPQENAAVVREFLRSRPLARHFDYGGGNGRLSSLLREGGVDSSTWDPMDAAAVFPVGRFDLVTAFEVFEHTPEPHATVEEILAFCDAEAPLILFSTFTIDRLAPRSMDFWYLSPRNGHITIHTESSLQTLLGRFDLRVHHYGNGWHLAHRAAPAPEDLALFRRLYGHGLMHRVAHRFARMVRGPKA